MPETCENCGKTIGSLETPHLHKDHVVCHACKKALAEQSPKPAAFTDPEANAKAGKVMARVALWIVGGLALIALFQVLASR